MEQQNYSHNNPFNQGDYRPWGTGEDQFCMFLHLSVFAGFIVPFGGIVLPLVMWLTQKEYSAKIDAHGKMVINFMISSFIYYIIGIVTACFIVGYFIILAVVICSVIFSVIGAIRASEGKLYQYPLTIPFIS